MKLEPNKEDICFAFTFAVLFWVAVVMVLFGEVIEQSFSGTFFLFIGIPVATHCTLTLWTLIKKYKTRYGADG